MTTSKPNFRSFIAVFASSTLSLASGAISVIATLVGLYTNPKYTKNSFFTVAGLAALFASYEVWAKERGAREAAEAYLTSADLKVVPIRAYRSQGAAWLLVEALVTNHSPAEVTIVDFDCVVLQSAELGDMGWTDVDPTNSFSARIIGTDESRITPRETPDLARRLQTLPLPRGHNAQGYFQFRFVDLPTDEKEIRLRLNLEDALGKTHTGTATVRYSVHGWIYLSQRDTMQF